MTVTPYRASSIEAAEPAVGRQSGQSPEARASPSSEAQRRSQNQWSSLELLPEKKPQRRDLKKGSFYEFCFAGEVETFELGPEQPVTELGSTMSWPRTTRTTKASLKKNA